MSKYAITIKFTEETFHNPHDKIFEPVDSNQPR